MSYTERWAVIVDVDPAPLDGPEFDAWCARQGFDWLNSGRRAWCSEFSTYLRDAYGVASCDGERFLVWRDDLRPIDATSRADTPCRYVVTSDEGTSHCTLGADSDAAVLRRRLESLAVVDGQAWDAEHDRPIGGVEQLVDWLFGEDGQ